MRFVDNTSSLYQPTLAAMLNATGADPSLPTPEGKPGEGKPKSRRKPKVVNGEPQDNAPASAEDVLAKVHPCP